MNPSNLESPSPLRGDDGEAGGWRTERAWRLDPDRGLIINEDEDESAAAYPRSRITAEHID